VRPAGHLPAAGRPAGGRGTAARPGGSGLLPAA
jgi:hypothetical protein